MLAVFMLSSPLIYAETMFPSESPPLSLAEWRVKAGDVLLVDTKENVGYLIHEDAGFTSFPVVTGQRRTVRYIGRVYNAATPAKKWYIESMEIKGDRTTFGPRGTFLRFFLGDEKTAYGIHAHKQGAEMLSSDERFRSYGCVIVSEEVMDILAETFHANGERIGVTTLYGLGEQSVTFEVLKKFVAHSSSRDVASR